jgi:hypothetical protein
VQTLRVRGASRRIMATLAAMTSDCVSRDNEVRRASGAYPADVQKPADSVVANACDVTFLGTVTNVDIGNLHHPYLRWVVNLKIDKVVSGPSPGEGFWLAIYSPSVEGIEVGQRYRITANKSRDRYTLVSSQRVD